MLSQGTIQTLVSLLTKPLFTSTTSKHRRKGRRHTVAPVPIFDLEGTLTKGRQSDFAVGESEFTISPDTWTVGDLLPGNKVRVKGTITNGIAVATSIVVVQH